MKRRRLPTSTNSSTCPWSSRHVLLSLYWPIRVVIGGLTEEDLFWGCWPLLQEVMRHRPPVTGLSRLLTEDLQVGNHTIKAGVRYRVFALFVLFVCFVFCRLTLSPAFSSACWCEQMNVLICIDAIHHDPELWPNPEVFDPTRFSEGTFVYSPKP